MRETRERLLQASAELFVESGYEAVSMDAIAVRADVARATAFNHFAVKRDLLVSHHVRLFRAFEGALAAHGDEGRSALDRLVAFFQVAEDVLAPERALVSVLYAQVVTDPKVLRVDEELGARFLDRIRAVLDAGKVSGELAPDLDTRLAVRVVHDVWSSTLRDWALRAGGARLATDMRSKLQLVVAGMRGPKRAPPKAAVGKRRAGKRAASR